MRDSLITHLRKTGNHRHAEDQYTQRFEPSLPSWIGMSIALHTHGKRGAKDDQGGEEIKSRIDKGCDEGYG